LWVCSIPLLEANDIKKTLITLWDNNGGRGKFSWILTINT
jgi:hypothetical protein